MCPQPSNRQALIDGTLRCLEKLPAERITARAIAAEAGANLASITYHFRSKDDLVTVAVIEGLDRWLEEIAARMRDLGSMASGARFQRAAEVVGISRPRHRALAANFVGAVARAQHDPKIRKLLAAGFHRARPNVAAVLALGSDATGLDAAGLLLAQFHGLLMQVLLDPSLAIDGARLTRAQARLRKRTGERSNAKQGGRTEIRRKRQILRERA